MAKWGLCIYIENLDNFKRVNFNIFLIIHHDAFEYIMTSTHVVLQSGIHNLLNEN